MVREFGKSVQARVSSLKEYENSRINSKKSKNGKRKLKTIKKEITLSVHGHKRAATVT